MPAQKTGEAYRAQKTGNSSRAVTRPIGRGTMFTSKLSRRNFMQQSALWASAFAAGGTLGLRKAMADRSKELNILCWEGYNSAQVLDPFREQTGATVKAESLTNDPTMIN